MTIIIEFMGEKNEANIILMPNIDNIVMKLCEKVKEIDTLKKGNENIKKEFIDYKNYVENKIKELESLIKKESQALKNNIKFYNGEYMKLTSEEYNKLKVKYLNLKKQ